MKIKPKGNYPENKNFVTIESGPEGVTLSVDYPAHGQGYYVTLTETDVIRVISALANAQGRVRQAGK